MREKKGKRKRLILTYEAAVTAFKCSYSVAAAIAATAAAATAAATRGGGGGDSGDAERVSLSQNRILSETKRNPTMRKLEQEQHRSPRERVERAHE